MTQNRNSRPTANSSSSFNVLIVHCVSKNITEIFDYNFKTNHQLLIIFGANIFDTTYHQITVQFPTLPNVCFCTT